ncbi:MAG TPA: hypothetical protein PK777_07390 [Thermoguttaceae bacterium]|nr:hypothetical protein [Thermoguttaceae bacterium]HPP52754.1 hypothetical protein [Thermoguttaceae bacterium]
MPGLGSRGGEVAEGGVAAAEGTEEAPKALFPPCPPAHAFPTGSEGRTEVKLPEEGWEKAEEGRSHAVRPHTPEPLPSLDILPPPEGFHGGDSEGGACRETPDGGAITVGLGTGEEVLFWEEEDSVF